MPGSPDILALIPARGGSKGVPRKNVLPVAGKPLIAWTIEAALRSARVSRVIVSTDNDEIAEVSRGYGAEIPFMRPAELAGDDSSSFEVAEHALHWLHRKEGRIPDYFLLLQPTSPLRQTQDIDEAASFAFRHQAASVVGVCETGAHPYITKRIAADGTLEDFVPVPIAFNRRQELPPAYIVNGAIYLRRSDSLLETRTFFPAGTHAYVMPPERSIDVDTRHDLALVEWMLQSQTR